MAIEVFIICRDDRLLMDLSIACRGAGFDVTAIERPDELTAARQAASRQPQAMIVMLDAALSVVELRDVLARAAETRFVFLSPALPLRAAVARVVNNAGAVAVSAIEPPIVIVSTLIALLARQPSARRGGAA